MTRLTKFTPLQQNQIERVISLIPVEMFYVARVVRSAIEENEIYQSLIGTFQSTENKKPFFEKNARLINEFLNDCGLLGYRGEKNNKEQLIYHWRRGGGTAFSLFTQQR